MNPNNFIVFRGLVYGKSVRKSIEDYTDYRCDYSLILTQKDLDYIEKMDEATSETATVGEYSILLQHLLNVGKKFNS